MIQPIDNDLAWGDVPDGAWQMDDEGLATAIRAKVNELRQAIVAARAAGLTVRVPAMVGHWLDTGTAPGEPGYWVIKEGIALTDIDPGLREAINLAVEIARDGLSDMYVSHSPDGEYTSSYDVEATRDA